MTMMSSKQRTPRLGQQVLEYILISIAVLVLVIAFVSKNSPFQKAFNKALDSSSQLIEARNAELKLGPAGSFPQEHYNGTISSSTPPSGFLSFFNSSGSTTAE